MVKQAVPGGFKFEPRAFVAVRREFGRSSSPVRPAPGIQETDPRFLAAQLQHAVANAVREGVLALGLSLEDFVTRENAAESENSFPPGLTYDRLVRIQRGETLMQLADLVSWARRFDTVRTILTDERNWPAGCREQEQP